MTQTEGGKAVSEMPDVVWVHWTEPKEDRAELYWDVGEFSAIRNPELKAACIKYIQADLHAAEVAKLNAEVEKLKAELARVKGESVRVDVLRRWMQKREHNVCDAGWPWNRLWAILTARLICRCPR